MNFKELEIFVKYCRNQIGHGKFLEIMRGIYYDDTYASALWESFRDTPIIFIVARGEEELFDIIQEEIIKTNYKG